jgi:hypothetical protein
MKVSVRVRQNVRARSVLIDLYARCECGCDTEYHDYLGQVYSLGYRDMPGFVPVYKMEEYPREPLPDRLQQQLERQLNVVAGAWRPGDAYEVSIPYGPVVKLADAGSQGDFGDVQLGLPGLSPHVHNINAARKRKRPA